MIDGIITPETAEFRARAFVSGMVDEIKHGERTGRQVIHTGHWSAHFAGHPWVEASESGGWGRDLRMSVTQAVKRRIMGGRPYHDVDQLMPPKEVVDFWREKAASRSQAAAWQEDHFVTQHGTPAEPRPLGAATREVCQKTKRMTGKRNAS